jgi:excisionase family DNA binding protein
LRATDDAVDDIDRLANAVAERLRAERDDRDLLNARQVARRLGVGERTAWGMIERGTIPSVRVGPKLRRVEPAALDAYIASLRGEEAK